MSHAQYHTTAYHIQPPATSPNNKKHKLNELLSRTTSISIVGSPPLFSQFYILQTTA